MRAFACALAACLLATVEGHGQLTWPPSTRHGGNIHRGADCAMGECYWFSNNVEVEAPSLPASMRSMEPEIDGGKHDVFRTSPWRAPGKAAVYGAGCGVAGGHPAHAYANGGVPPEGYSQGFDGVHLPRADAATVKWLRGGVAELAWAMSANHAGGYAYRICRADTVGGVTEACFQEGHLAFADEGTSFVVYPNGTRVGLPRALTTEGTHPEGSQWARTGIPSCRECDRAYDTCGGPLPPVPGLDYGSQWNTQVNCYAKCAGSVSSKEAPGHCPDQTQFAVSHPSLRVYSGFGKSLWEWSVLDRVRVPADIPLGDYVVSWRWDCEESAQVWQNCADVTVVAAPEDTAFDTATAEAVQKVPKPGVSSAPADARAGDGTSKTDAKAFEETGGVDCAAWVTYCEGKGEEKGKCGATEKETLGMCEKHHADNRSKAGDGPATNAKGSSAAPLRVNPHSWVAALATVLCVATTSGLNA